MDIIDIKKNVGGSVSLVKGRVKSVYELKGGQGKKGPYTMQNGMIEDATGVIRVTFWNRQDMARLKGSIVAIEGKLKVDKRGDYEPELGVPGNAVVRTEGQTAPTQQAQAPRKAGTASATQTTMNLTSAAEFIQKSSVLYGECLKAARFQAAKLHIQESDVKDVASCLFIEASKNGLVNAMTVPLPGDELVGAEAIILGEEDRDMSDDDIPF